MKFEFYLIYFYLFYYSEVLFTTAYHYNKIPLKKSIYRSPTNLFLFNFFGNKNEDGNKQSVNSSFNKVEIVENDDASYLDDDQTVAVLTDDICLVPGDPIVRVEEAPGNSRRIFTGIDISCNIDTVWNLLTTYENLHKVVPSLVKNEVLSRTSNGARLLQVGGAKVLPGVTFTAKTILDVVTYLENNPIPLSMIADHLEDTASDSEVRSFDKKLPLIRGVFPRPFAITSLPCRDITMQNVPGEGDFEHYQGIWRMQPLPNCNPSGGDATRLTYAVEIKPKGILPVKLIEGRIASDLKTNLMAIRDTVESQTIKLKELEKNTLKSERSAAETSEYVPSPSINTPAMASVLSGIKVGQEEEIMDIKFENKMLKKRVEYLESELLKKEEILNTIRKQVN